MKNLIKILKTSAFVLLFASCTTDVEEITTTEANTEVSDTNIVSARIPSGINLKCPYRDGETLSASDLNTTSIKNAVEKWYNKTSSTAIEFNLYDGDRINRNPGTSNSLTDYARSEIGTTDEFKAGSTVHVYQGTYNLNKKLNEELTIAQIFAVGVGPQLRIILTEDGHLKAGSRGNDNITIDNSKNWANTNFKLAIRTNGKTFSIYLNDKRVSISSSNDDIEEYQDGNTNAQYQFRFGIYYNSPMYTRLQLKLSNIDIRTESSL